MKNKILLLLLIVFAVCLCACEQINGFELTGKDVDVSLPTHSGSIGEFALIAPAEDEIVTSVPTFCWQKADNADSYTLEVCSSTTFVQEDNDVYVKKTGITTTEFTIGAQLKNKNRDYFWRVTAVNATNKKACSQLMGKFYLSAVEVDEVDFDIEYADEWEVHEEGSFATVQVDKSNFFGNGKNSLKVSFVEEDTNRGIPSSDGWMVITHSAETEMYGVDAFFFNFYYSGNDSDVYLRVVDADNEYWHAQIKLANNAKQNVIIRFDQFELRTKGGTTIANQVFDYNHIKNIELVFEKSFGDGVAMISDLKAVRYDDYTDLFISQMNFASVAQADIIKDNYDFGVQITNDGRTLTYSYGSMNGYGFVKMPVNKLLVSGDAFSVKLSREQTANNATILFRLIEEDGDRWVYRHKINQLTNGEEVIIPFSAFTLSEYKGDGARQFYYVQQFQFGLEGNYQSGSITFDELKVVTMADVVPDLYQGSLADDGTIDNFDGYDSSVDVYYVWQTSAVNKDESMTLDKEFAFGSGNTCVKLGYKADMFPACYGVQFEGKEGFSALQIWARDNSVKNSEAYFNYLGDVSAKMNLTLFVNTGEQYVYTIDKVNKFWTNYVISLDDFALDGTYYGAVTPLTSENIAGLMISLQYFYYLQDGTSHPVYTSNNYVYVDSIALTTAVSSEVKELAHKIVPSQANPNLAVVEDFNSGVNQFSIASSYGYEGLELVDSYDKQCLQMSYQGKSDSVSYAMTMLVDSSVSEAKAIQLTLKGNGTSDVYVNVFFEYANTTYKYRYFIQNVASEWTTYTIGFDNFTKIEGTGSVALSKTQVPNVNKITFGIVDWDKSGADVVLVDDICFVSGVSYAVNTAVTLEK